MKKIFTVLGSLSLASLMLTGCGGGDDDDPPEQDASIATDSGLIEQDSGITEFDAGPDIDAGPVVEDGGSAPEDGGSITDAGTCTPRTEEEARESDCSSGALTAACGPKTVPDGCGGSLNINCGCSGDLKCDTEDTYTCIEGCVPLTSNTGNAYYCNHAPTFWQCGGKIERDDLCGGKVTVNCGGETACKGGTTCDTDPESDNYLHCVKTSCTPADETDEDFCTRYHSECGTADGEDSCNNVKHVDCGSCVGTDICVSQLAAGGYVQRTCEAKPNAISLNACTETEGDTSAADASHVMMVEKNGSYLYSAPEKIYAFKASASGSVTVTATPWNTSDFDLVLYVVDDLSSRTPIKLANNGTYGVKESLTFEAVSAKTYYIVVDGGDWSSNKYDRGLFHVTVDDGTCTPAVNPYDGKVVISAVYSGGNGPKYPIWNEDFIELHNQGSTDVDINGYSLMKTDASNTTGKNWQEITNFNRSIIIPAGGYYLVSSKLPEQTDRTAQDLPASDKEVGNTKFQLGEAQKIFLSTSSSVTSSTLNAAGTSCPTSEQGFLVVYGAMGACGSSLPELPNATSALPYLGYMLYSEDGCAAFTDKTALDVTTKVVIDDAASHQTHTEISAISPVPRTSGTAVHQCGN